MWQTPVSHNLFNQYRHFAYGDAAMWLKCVQHLKMQYLRKILQWARPLECNLVCKKFNPLFPPLQKSSHQQHHTFKPFLFFLLLSLGFFIWLPLPADCSAGVWWWPLESPDNSSSPSSVSSSFSSPLPDSLLATAGFESSFPSAGGAILVPSMSTESPGITDKERGQIIH